MDSSNSDFKQFWNKKTFAIITGASRGIGRMLAENLAAVVAPSSLLLLIARDETRLTTLRAHIEEKRPDIRVHVSAIDLSTSDELTLSGVINASLEGDSPNQFDHALCVHNVGSLGDPTKKCSDLLQFNKCTEYMQLNIASVIVLNAIFLRVFGGVERKTVVNMSSLCGIKPYASLSLYCTGKAARDMFFKVLAKEEPEVRVLNYAPGPVETDMRETLLKESFAEELKVGSRNDLTTDVTCNRLLDILASDKFASGDHVDYFDS